jgi:hypothetical protein
VPKKPEMPETRSVHNDLLKSLKDCQQRLQRGQSLADQDGRMKRRGSRVVAALGRETSVDVGGPRFIIGHPVSAAHTLAESQTQTAVEFPSFSMDDISPAAAASAPANGDAVRRPPVSEGSRVRNIRHLFERVAGKSNLEAKESSPTQEKELSSLGIVKQHAKVFSSAKATADEADKASELGQRLILNMEELEKHSIAGSSNDGDESSCSSDMLAPPKLSRPSEFRVIKKAFTLPRMLSEDSLTGDAHSIGERKERFGSVNSLESSIISAQVKMTNFINTCWKVLGILFNRLFASSNSTGSQFLSQLMSH